LVFIAIAEAAGRIPGQCGCGFCATPRAVTPGR
jgi:hypothetical protein